MILKRGNTWTYAADIGRDEDGRRIRRWKGGFRTKREAQAALNEFMHHVSLGGDPFPAKITVGQYVTTYLDHQSTRTRPRTLIRYRSLLERYILPVVGRLELRRVKPAHVRAILDSMAQQGLSPRTRIQARAVVSSVLRQAIEDGLIETNAAQAVRPPKAERPRLKVPTPEELATLIRAARETPWEIPILLAATTGARRSEVLALRWADIDLLHDRLRFVQSLQRLETGKRVGFLDLKTSRARREVALPSFVAARLKTHRQEQTVRRLALGPGWQDLDLLCERGDGGVLYPDSFTAAFKRLAVRAGLHPGTRLHDVRHGVATAMLAEGVHPAIASAVLGHSAPSFTMSTYQHLLDGMTAQAAAALDRALDGCKLVANDPQSASKQSDQEAEVQVRQWGRLDSNQRPTDYESAALTN